MKELKLRGVALLKGSGIMKRKILGTFIMIIGLAMIATSTALISAASSNGSQPVAEQSARTPVIIGTYYSEDGASIKVLDDVLLQMSGSEIQSYELNIWKDIPETDEATGKITLKNHYYLQLEQSRIKFIPEKQALELNGQIYTKA